MGSPQRKDREKKPKEIINKILDLRTENYGESRDRALSRVLCLGPHDACGGAALPVGFRAELRAREREILAVAHEMAQGLEEAEYVSQALQKRDPISWSAGLHLPASWKGRVRALASSTHVSQSALLREAIRRGLDLVEAEEEGRHGHRNH